MELNTSDQGKNNFKMLLEISTPSFFATSPMSIQPPQLLLGLPPKFACSGCFVLLMVEWKVDSQSWWLPTSSIPSMSLSFLLTLRCSRDTVGFFLPEGLVLAVHYDSPFMSFRALPKCHLFWDVFSAALGRSVLVTPAICKCMYVFMHVCVHTLHACSSVCTYVCVSSHSPHKNTLSEAGTLFVSFITLYEGSSTVPHS